MVTSLCMSTVWCSRPYKPYILWKLIIWWWQWPRRRLTKRQSRSCLMSVFYSCASLFSQFRRRNNMGSSCEKITLLETAIFTSWTIMVNSNVAYHHHHHFYYHHVSVKAHLPPGTNTEYLRWFNLCLFFATWLDIGVIDKIINEITISHHLNITR